MELGHKRAEIHPSLRLALHCLVVPRPIEAISRWLWRQRMRRALNASATAQIAVNLQTLAEKGPDTLMPDACGNATPNGERPKAAMDREEWDGRYGRRGPGFLSFLVGTAIGCFVASIVAGSSRIDSCADYLGVLAVALVYQQWIWPLILGWRPWR